MNVDEVVAHAQKTVADIAAGRSVEDVAFEVEPVLASLADDLVFVWMNSWVREHRERCHLQDLPPLEGPWEGSLGTAFSAGESDFVGISLAFQGRPGPVVVVGPERAQEDGILDAVRDDVLDRGLTNLQVFVLEWDIVRGNASQEDFLDTLQVAAGNAVYDAMLPFSARRHAFLDAQLKLFNAKLNSCPSVHDKIVAWGSRTEAEKDDVLARFGLSRGA